MKFIVILFLLFTSIYTLAQQSDSQLAYTYYQAKEYDKAAEKFLKLYERTHSANFLDYYIICLINGKEYDKAEATLKKNPNNDIGYEPKLKKTMSAYYETEGDNRDLEKMGRPENLLCKRQFQEDFPRQDSLIGYCSPGISNHATLPKNRSLRACFQDEEAVVFTVLTQPNSTGIWKPQNKQR